MKMLILMILMKKILHGVKNEKIMEERYGLKVFLPIAKNYSFSHYDDFGNSRSYGFKRVHLGNDLMGSIGTPIVAVESGIIEHLGWNQYGGWRIGIRSFDGKRYYYYAHLRKNHPYAEGIEEGMTVKAGDVIGYLGMTGYSTKENVNNINVPHLHFGMQLIFDESQVDSPNEIWIDVYQIIEFLMQNRSEVYQSNTETKDYSRKYDFMEERFEGRNLDVIGAMGTCYFASLNAFWGRPPCTYPSVIFIVFCVFPLVTLSVTSSFGFFV